MFDVQLFASVTVILYVPAAKAERSSVVTPPPQLYEYGDVPPVTVTFIAPVEFPKHATFVAEV